MVMMSKDNDNADKIMRSKFSRFSVCAIDITYGIKKLTFISLLVSLQIPIHMCTNNMFIKHIQNVTLKGIGITRNYREVASWQLKNRLCCPSTLLCFSANRLENLE